MDNRLIKFSKRGFFSKHKKKLDFNVGLEADGKYAIFSLCGPNIEVENRFYHMLQVVKQVSYYQVDGNFSTQFKGNSLYKIGIDLNSSDVLTDMFWYLAKSWRFFDENKLLANFNRLDKTGKQLDTAAKAARRKQQEPLPDYVPKIQNEPDRHRKFHKH